MSVVAFDTLAYAKRLEAAGVDARLAEAQAQALAEVLKGAVGELATKHDLKEMELRITLRLGGLIVAGVGVLAVLMRIF